MVVMVLKDSRIVEKMDLSWVPLLVGKIVEDTKRMIHESDQIIVTEVSWLLRLLNPKINFHFYPLQVDDKPLVLLEIGAAFRHPVQFKNSEFIRVGSYKKRLKDFPEKERDLWRVFDRTPFEREIAAENLATDEILKLLDYPAYFDLLSLPLPEGRDGILIALAADEMIAPDKSGKWNITNLGAMLFAKRLADFRSLSRKAVRIILYKGENRVETVREQ